MSDKLSARENTLVGKTTSDIYVDLDLDGQDDWDRVYEIIDRVFGNTRQAALPDDTLDKAAYIAATICAHGYLQNTEDEGRVAHVIRQSLAALPDDADPQAGDVETIAEGDEEAGEANLRNSYARTKAMHSKNYASVGDADWDAAVLADEIDRLRAALPTPCPPGRWSRLFVLMNIDAHSKISHRIAMKLAIMTPKKLSKNISKNLTNSPSPHRGRSREMNTSCRECVYYPVEFKKKPCFNCARGDRFEAKTPPKTYADGIAQGRREAAEAYCDSECAWSSAVGCQRKIGECTQYNAILGAASDEKGV